MLPKHLEKTLVSLLEDHGLAGWSIHGSQQMTSVILRFKMEDNNEIHQNQSVKFKKVCPSQMARDTLRSQKWKENIDKCEASCGALSNEPSEVEKVDQLKNANQDSTSVYIKTSGQDMKVPPKTKVSSPIRARSKTLEGKPPCKPPCKPTCKPPNTTQCQPLQVDSKVDDPSPVQQLSGNPAWEKALLKYVGAKLGADYEAGKKT
mgnify:CR=1 FL=1